MVLINNSFESLKEFRNFNNTHSLELYQLYIRILALVHRASTVEKVWLRENEKKKQLSLFFTIKISRNIQVVHDAYKENVNPKRTFLISL